MFQSLFTVLNLTKQEVQEFEEEGLLPPLPSMASQAAQPASDFPLPIIPQPPPPQPLSPSASAPGCSAWGYTHPTRARSRSPQRPTDPQNRPFVEGKIPVYTLPQSCPLTQYHKVFVVRHSHGPLLIIQVYT